MFRSQHTHHTGSEDSVRHKKISIRGELVELLTSNEVDADSFSEELKELTLEYDFEVIKEGLNAFGPDYTSTPLVEAILHYGKLKENTPEAKNQFYKIETLIKTEAVDVNRGRFAATPLHLASTNNLLDIVDILLKHPKIERNKTCDGGKTELYRANEKGHKRIVERLMKDPRVDKKYLDVRKGRSFLFTPSGANKSNSNTQGLLSTTSVPLQNAFNYK